MDADTQKAKHYLQQQDCTCVLIRADRVFSSHQRGVRPLLELLESGKDYRGFCAADKVVGRATAFLYCLLGVKSIYAGVLSQPAAQVLEDAGILVYTDRLVPGIRNRTDTGPCPMEAATENIRDPHQALEAIGRAMEKLSNRDVTP